MAQDPRPVNTGLADNARTAVAESLIDVLADTYAVYAKTHGFHWNVTGPQFQTLHTLFETQYNELWVVLDEIAERIRALGVFAPGDFSSLAARTAIEPAPAEPPSGDDMVRHLLADHETLVRRLRAAVEVAGEANDDVSEDFLIGRLQIHEKTAWMLRAMTA
ncbi:MAG: DNA starvation/stationary phase protection protein [Pseudomonadota bacterium]